MEGFSADWLDTWAFDGSSRSQLQVTGPFFDFSMPSMVTFDRP
jgi:hypothetical protein